MILPMNVEGQSAWIKNAGAIAVALVMLAALYASSLYSYLLFHTLAEVFSVIVAGSVFMVAWNSRRQLDNQYLLFIGVAYLFVGILDLTHTFTYEGLYILTGYDANTPTQLWIAARYLQSASLLAAPLMFRRRVRPGYYLIGFGGITTLLLGSILYWQNFPDCFVESAGGLTTFKKVSEYIICLFLLASGALIVHFRRKFDPEVIVWLLVSIVTTTLSEVAFTTYASVYGPANMLGHLFKIVSFYCVYKAIIETGLARPIKLLFRELNESKERYHSLFVHMIDGFSNHEVVYDAEGRPVDYVFLEVNKTFEKMTGLSGVVGKRVTEVLPDIKNDSTDWIGVYGRVATSGESVRLESYSEAMQKWYSVTAYSVRKGQVVTVFKDITERKGAQAALHELNNALEEKVRERTATLAHLVDTLETEIDLRKKTEIELATANRKLVDRADQLRALTGELALAEQRERKRLSKVLHDGLQQLLAIAKLQMNGLRSDLKNNELEKTAGNIESLIGEGIQLSRSLSTDLSPPILYEGGLSAGLKWLTGWMREKHAFDVELTVDDVVVLPEDVNVLVFESVRELLFNAFKHANVSRARVRMQFIEGTGLRITVADAGDGFDSNKLKPAGSNGGGFGLFSIRERIGLLGGRLEIDSAPGKGSRFTLTVPHGESVCINPSTSTPAGETVETGPRKGEQVIRLLIADDHSLIRDGLVRIVSREPDIDVVGQARDGREVIEFARELKPDVILMDISMPHFNGVEATRLILQESPGIRIIALSMHEDQDHVLAMRYAGAKGYINKGCAAAELLDAIRGNASKDVLPMVSGQQG